jgi:hypothetical protein
MFQASTFGASIAHCHASIENMSSKNKKQKHRRLRPMKYQPEPIATSRSGPMRVIVPVLVLLVAAVVVYAVVRPKSGSRPGAATTTPSPAVSSKTPSAKAAPPIAGPHFEAGANTYDFGRVSADKPVDCLISFTNTGTQPLVLTNVEPGCYCMKIGQWTREVAPGQVGTMSVRVDTSHVTGPFGKSVFITCNDPSQRSPRMEVKGFVFRPLEITPPSAIINLSSEVPSNNAAVKIINHLDEPLTLSDIAITLTNVVVDLQTNQPGKEYQLNVRTIPPLATTSERGRISFKTSTTNAPPSDINVGVNFLPVLQAVPFQLRVSPPPYTNETSVMAWVRNNGTNTLVIKEATVNLPGVEVEAKDDPMNQGQSLTVKFPAGFATPIGTNAELLVKTTHPQYPELRLPFVQIAPPPAKAK